MSYVEIEMYNADIGELEIVAERANALISQIEAAAKRANCYETECALEDLANTLKDALGDHVYPVISSLEGEMRRSRRDGDAA